MEPVVCLNCYEFFPPSPRHKNQRYCMKPPCRRAKKAAWKRHKMATDPDFKLDQKLSNQKWAQNTPGYWKDYRERNPQKAERNRILQSVRNRRRAKQGKSDRKVDASVIASSGKAMNRPLYSWSIACIRKAVARPVFPTPVGPIQMMFRLLVI